MSNQDIRAVAKASGVKLWQIAEALGIADCNFSRKLRTELSDSEKAKVYAIIAKIAGGDHVAEDAAHN